MELMLAGITTVAAANVYLRERYIGLHNARFAVEAEQPGSAFVPLPGVDLREVLCHEEECPVGNDNTVVLRKVRLQIPPSPVRAHMLRPWCACGGTLMAVTVCSTGRAALDVTMRPGWRWPSKPSTLLDGEDV